MPCCIDSLQQKIPLKSKDGIQDKHLFFVDLIRTYAVIMVVIGHTAALAMLSFSSISESSWWVANILFSSAHQAFPLYIMVSGLLLLDPEKDESLTIFFRKRVNKIVWPFLFWSAFYYFWRILYKGESITVSQAFIIVAKGPIYYHLWFIYKFLGLYLITPILRFYIKAAPMMNLLYFGACWLVFGSLLPIFSSFTGISVGIYKPFFSGLIGYFLLGPLLNQLKFQNKYNWLIILAVISATLFTAMGTHFLTLRSNGQYQGYFINLHMLNIITLSIGMFFLLKKCQYIKLLKRKHIAILVKDIAVSSFGIILLHPVVIEILDAGCFGFQLNAMSFHTIISIPLTAIVTITISFLVVTMLRRIPFLKQIVP